MSVGGQQRYDDRNCPRGDGGWLRLITGDFADEPWGDRRWECSVCQRWWTVIELKRLPVEEQA